MKLTRHNGRKGKNGVYNPKHNDRRFDVSNSDHIADERLSQNIYWDCYQGFTVQENRKDSNKACFSFEQIEERFYFDRYIDYTYAQNLRNEKTRHTERNRYPDDLLKNSKTCPEETIYQIGTLEDSVSSDELAMIVAEFLNELQERFGKYYHTLDWALHLDEGTPHIHERHVFDCENKYGEICPQQEKALEALGIPLPNPDKPKGKNNNRKQTFDVICRTLLFDICKKHGLKLDEEPTYGGREYLEKQDYIIFKQNEEITKQEEKLDELKLQISDIEKISNDVAEVAYRKAVETVTEAVQAETQKEDLKIISKYQKQLNAPEQNIKPKYLEIINNCLNAVQNKLKKSAKQMVDRIKEKLISSKDHREPVRKAAKESLLAKLKKPLPTKPAEKQKRRDIEI